MTLMDTRNRSLNRLVFSLETRVALSPSRLSSRSVKIEIVGGRGWTDARREAPVSAL